jgi:membrane protein DedA with SNARE-associated domain
MQRGGQALLRRRFKRENIERVERAYARYGVLAIAIPALLPPPMPFKIFVATAGTLEYPRWKFLVTVMIARSVRYYVEGILAVFYGRRVLSFLRDNGLVILSLVAAAAVLILLVYAIINWRNPRPINVRTEESVEQKPLEDPNGKKISE